MKRTLCLLILSFVLQKNFAQYSGPLYPPYKGTDLGLTYTPEGSSFRIWSPVATAAELQLYRNGMGSEPTQVLPLIKGAQGTWTISLPGDQKGMFYTFRVKIGNRWSDAVTDPYCKAVGVNGRRAAVVNLAETNPPNWVKDKSPSFSRKNLPTDAVIYELHVRDASIHPGSGIAQKGKFAGLAEENTRSAGTATGLSHLKEMGVTHIHLLPFYDFNSIDEAHLEKNEYNWGYDPLNYNVPEGSYSSDASDGKTRIRELKELVAAFHRNGLRIVMDVVYNHTGLTERSNFNQLVPGYYYRHKKDGAFSDATACGNETASEMPMMRKFMVESLIYWVKEYHIDGFRFDLMGVHDIETMNLISAELHKIKPDILLYGEGWTAGGSPLADSLRALKGNVSSLEGIAVFGDDLRDGLKGSVFKLEENGFVSGATALSESVKFGIVAACEHPQVKYTRVNYSKKPYAKSPADVISYCECHDNNVLWDKLAISNPTASVEDRKKMHRLALTIVLTSQGIPFLHAGTEFLRSKKGIENSYNSGDSINAIDWSLKKDNHTLVKYVQQLISIRKAHPAFRMTTASEVAANIQFEENANSGTIVYTINGAAMKDSWKKIWIAFNGTNASIDASLPIGDWQNALESKPGRSYNKSIQVEQYGAVILFQQ